MGKYQPENKKILKEFIEFSNRFRSVTKAITLYREVFDRKEINRIIRMLSNIDTSFVTATSEVAKLFNRGYIPTPLELYEKWCC